MPAAIPLAAAAISAGGAVYSANKNAKATKDAAKISAANSDIGAVGANSLAAQQNLAPTQLQLESQYRPQYAALVNNMVGSSLLGDAYSGGSTASAYSAPASTAYPTLGSVAGVSITANPADYPAHWYTNWQSTQAQTKMDFPTWVSNVLQSSPQFASEIEAVRTSNSAGSSGAAGGTAAGSSGSGNTGIVGTLDTAAQSLQGTQSAVDTAARAAGLADIQNLGAGYYDAWRSANPQLSGLQDKLYTDATSGSDLLQTLKGQTLADLQNGGKLSADELRDVQQGVRSAYTARGLGGSNSAIFAEALNRNRYANERRTTAQNRALAVDNYATGLTNTATNTIYGTGFNPQTILDQNSTALGTAIGAYGLASGQATSAGPTIFNPYSSDIMSYYSGQSANAAANKAASSSSNAAYANAAASIGSSLINAYANRG